MCRMAGKHADGLLFNGSHAGHRGRERGSRKDSTERPPGRRAGRLASTRARYAGMYHRGVEFRDASNEFEAHDATVLGISDDPISLNSFRDDHGLEFDLSATWAGRRFRTTVSKLTSKTSGCSASHTAPCSSSTTTAKSPTAGSPMTRPTSRTTTNCWTPPSRRSGRRPNRL